MSEHEHHVIDVGLPIGDLGKSIFPIFSVNVPMPADTSPPLRDAPAGPPRAATADKRGN
jgi:hypothetical protein